jgi:hypothetical protein
MIRSPFLMGRDRYQRVVEGWIDNTHRDALTHTVRITDDDFAVECQIVATPSPAYEVREARARILNGPIDPALPEAFGRIAKGRMVSGFTRRLTEVCGPRAGNHLLVDAGIEVARLARQVTKLPQPAVSGLVRGDARACWELDRAGWADLPDSCFTYSNAGQALLASRPVSTPIDPELYCPSPGAAKVFVRRKLARLVQTDDRLHLFNSMHDNVHGFDLHYEIDLSAGKVVAADSITSRLPYAGICGEPQRRLVGMIGLPADEALRKRSQQILGGESGCAQLYDLTADLLKLISFGA